ncbi:hypothetical protein [Nocardia farcinica]|uniref:hypothetical protein n=1 Tax=Nocardia farcinica TaxID=37329 RepID=UPI0012FEEF84|nr:hypothetical protein [Nocardia farcinica]
MTRDADEERIAAEGIASPLGDDAPAEPFRLQGEIDRVVSRYRAGHPKGDRSRVRRSR